MIKKNSLRDIALLIDGDNAQPSTIGKIIQEVEKYGKITIRRVYGNSTHLNAKSWKTVITDHKVTPIKLSSLIKGKNITDIKLIADALKILAKEEVTGFCIVSSDSDFKILIDYIHEDKLPVIIAGKKKEATVLKKSCDLFISVENLSEEPQKSPAKKPVKTKTPAPALKPATKLVTQRVSQPKSPTKQNSNEPLFDLLKRAYGKSVMQNGWARLSSLGRYLYQEQPQFTVNDYGHEQLSQLILSHPKWFEIRDKDSFVEVRLKIQ